MNKIFLILTSIILISLGATAQTDKTYDIELYNKTSVEEALVELSKNETEFWSSKFDFDSTMKSRVYYSSYSTYMQMMDIMKQLNYTIEKNLLQEYYSFKIRRERFMKTFLTEKQYLTYQEIVAAAAKKELTTSQLDEPTKEILGLRRLAAGWNVLGHTITYR